MGVTAPVCVIAVLHRRTGGVQCRHRAVVGGFRLLRVLPLRALRRLAHPARPDVPARARARVRQWWRGTRSGSRVLGGHQGARANSLRSLPSTPANDPFGQQIGAAVVRAGRWDVSAAPLLRSGRAQFACCAGGMYPDSSAGQFPGRRGVGMSTPAPSGDGDRAGTPGGIVAVSRPAWASRASEKCTACPVADNQGPKHALRPADLVSCPAQFARPSWPWPTRRSRHCYAAAAGSRPRSSGRPSGRYTRAGQGIDARAAGAGQGADRGGVHGYGRRRRAGGEGRRGPARRIPCTSPTGIVTDAILRAGCRSHAAIRIGHARTCAQRSLALQDPRLFPDS